MTARASNSSGVVERSLRPSTLSLLTAMLCRQGLTWALVTIMMRRQGLSWALPTTMLCRIMASSRIAHVGARPRCWNPRFTVPLESIRASA
eukprot:11160483-Lingulodinium_polyedra.AAC.1